MCFGTPGLCQCLYIKRGIMLFLSIIAAHADTTASAASNTHVFFGFIAETRIT